MTHLSDEDKVRAIYQWCDHRPAQTGPEDVARAVHIFDSLPSRNREEICNHYAGRLADMDVIASCRPGDYVALRSHACLFYSGAFVSLCGDELTLDLISATPGRYRFDMRSVKPGSIRRLFPRVRRLSAPEARP